MMSMEWQEPVLKCQLPLSRATSQSWREQLHMDSDRNRELGKFEALLQEHYCMPSTFLQMSLGPQYISGTYSNSGSLHKNSIKRTANRLDKERIFKSLIQGSCPSNYCSCPIDRFRAGCDKTPWLGSNAPSSNQTGNPETCMIKTS